MVVQACCRFAPSLEDGMEDGMEDARRFEI
jgi:hypothetical protein